MDSRRLKTGYRRGVVAVNRYTRARELWEPALQSKFDGEHFHKLDIVLDGVPSRDPRRRYVTNCRGLRRVLRVCSRQGHRSTRRPSTYTREADLE